MQVNHLHLKDFRNYESLSLDFSPEMNMIVGENGQGKTNIVEAIHFLSFAKSFRSNRDRDVIQFQKNAAYIKAEIESQGQVRKIDMKLSEDRKKAINIDASPIVKMADLMGVLNVVVFCPEDIKIVSDAPVNRRIFMDKEISQLRPVYYSLLLAYNKILNNKNHFLKSPKIDSVMLDIYDEQLAENMAKIMQYRESFVEKIAPIAGSMHSKISSEKENLHIEYKPNLCAKKKEDIIDELKKNRLEDIRLATSKKGIHRDDIGISIGGIDIRKFGSQGQKKTATIALKLSEIDLIHEWKNVYPVVILDDIFSELDENRRKMLIEKLYCAQVFITNTEKIEINRRIWYIKVKNRSVEIDRK